MGCPLAPIIYLEKSIFGQYKLRFPVNYHLGKT